MRPLGTLVLLVALAAPASGQENDAEKLYRAMEKQLHAAKTLQFDFDLALDVAGQADKLKGQVALAEGDKARVEAEGANFGKPFKGATVSDGTKVVTKDSMKRGVETKDTPKKFNDRLLTGMARGSLFLSMEVVTDGGDPDEIATVGDFKLGAKEKVAGRDTQAVAFTLTAKQGATGSGVVWIDTTTGLPARISMKAGEMGSTFSIVETYDNMTVDAKLDPKLYELPK